MPKIVETSIKLMSAGGTSTAMFSLGEIISVPVFPKNNILLFWLVLEEN